MGIRFACHVCNKQLNIKRDLAGRRGVCPQCQSRFRIPMDDTEHSSPVDAVRMVHPNVTKSSEQAGSQSSAAQFGVSVGQDGGTAVMPKQQMVSTSAVPNAVEQPLLNVEQPLLNVEQPLLNVEQPLLNVEQPLLNTDAGQLAAGSILEEEPNATWYVRPPSGGQYGPASTEELQEWISQGRVAATALLWRDGWPQWRDASEALPEMSANLPGKTSAVLPSSAGSVVQFDSGGQQDRGTKSSVSLTGDMGLGAERRSRAMRRISLILILVAIAATLIGVLFYAISR